MALSPEDAFAVAHGFVDAEELEACREASLSTSQACPDNDPSAASRPTEPFAGNDVGRKFA